MKLNSVKSFLSLLMITCFCYSQNKQIEKINTTNSSKDIVKKTYKYILVNTIDKGDYFYIPHACLSDSVDAILFQNKTLLKVDPDNRPIEFYWSSRCIDGEYILTVTPQQIFFSTGHENPNPNFLFWIMDISKKQFQFISKGIREKTPKYFIDSNAQQDAGSFQDQHEYLYFQENFHEPCLMPKAWNKNTELHFSTCCDSTISRQLTLYFRILNNYIPADSDKLKLSNIQKSRGKFPIYFSSFEEDIHDWIGVRLNNNSD
jgi:hypothetical protein